MRAAKVSVLVLLLVSLAVPARAGGWWNNIGFDGQPVGTGESIDRSVGEVMFDTIEEAERAQKQSFYAYLVLEFDEEAMHDALSRGEPGDWWSPLTEPIRAGTVELSNWNANLADVRVHLDVPRVAPGPYSLMLCDEGCRAPLGDFIPSKVEVTADVLAARTTRRLQETEGDLRLALRRTRNDVRSTRAALQQALSEDARQDAEQAERIRVLGGRLAGAPRPDGPPWFAYAGWFAAGAAVAVLLVGRRRRPSRELEVLVERIPDDARELTTTR